MQKMNEFEARLALHRKIVDVFAAFYEEPTQDDIEGAEQITEMLLDALGVQVISVEYPHATLRVDVGDWESARLD